MKNIYYIVGFKISLDFRVSIIYTDRDYINVAFNNSIDLLH